MKKLLLSLVPLMLLASCRSNESKANNNSLSWCIKKLQEKKKYESFVYTYEKLETYNYDYSYERVREDSKVDGYIISVYNTPKEEYICVIEYNPNVRKITETDIYNIYCKGIY